MNFPPVPITIKSVNHYIKIAEEHEKRNLVVSYWTLMYAVTHTMKTLHGAKPPDVSRLLGAIMDWLEKTKNENVGVEGFTNETTAQAMIEEYALNLFHYAEEEEKNDRYHKNMVKAFYNTAIIMETLQQFGTLSDDIKEKQKFARWRAAHIHGCLKIGEKPLRPDVIIHTSKEDEMINGISFVVPRSEDDPPPERPILPPDENMIPPFGMKEFPNFAKEPTPPASPSIDTDSTIEGSQTSPDTLPPELMEKAQKYCKWASSALNYDDVKTAVDNLQKALSILQTGKEL